MQKRIIAIGLVFLLLFSTVIPISIGYDVKKSDSKGQSSNLGNTLYVGSFGPDNYTRIQDAINDSVDGDTIFVYDDSSPYNELIIVDKSITVQGENRYTTIITKGGFSI